VIRAATALLMAAQLFGGGERNTREGTEHFEAGRLEEALRAFSRAEGEVPEAPENDLNIAGVHYRLGEAEGAAAGEEGPLAEALRGYQAALKGGVSGEVRRDAYFNLANTLFRAGAFREAAAAFGEAIALDPEDLEARQNLERALRAAEEPQQQGGGQGEDQQESPQPEQDEGEQDQDGQGQSRQDPPPPGQEGQQDRESGEEQESPPEGSPPSADRPPAGDPRESTPEEAGPDADNPESVPGEVPEISPEQAERILAALADIERAFQEEQLERRRARALRRGRH